VKKNTYNFEFYPDEENEHESSIRLSFELPPDAHCSLIHSMCKRFAIALGYAPQTVEEVFGDDRFEE
jgi:hypothetical protein